MRSAISRRRERRRQEIPAGELQLAAMVDMMINLLLFLLNLYGNTTGAVQPSQDLVFAESTEVAPVRFAPTVVVSNATVTVGTEVVGTWSSNGGRAPDGGEAERLIAALEALPRGEDREILVQIDHRVAWQAVGPVLAAAGDAGFADVRFAVSSTGE